MNKEKRNKRAKAKLKENRITRSKRWQSREPKFIEKSMGNGEYIKVPNPFYKQERES